MNIKKEYIFQGKHVGKFPEDGIVSSTNENKESLKEDKQRARVIIFVIISNDSDNNLIIISRILIGDNSGDRNSCAFLISTDFNAI